MIENLSTLAPTVCPVLSCSVRAVKLMDRALCGHDPLSYNYCY
jgi:hypothetical protein